jgi:putative lipoprotein
LKITLPLLIAAAALLAGAGCDHLAMGQVDAGPLNRTVTGTVRVRSEAALPPDAKIAVRVLDTANPALPPQVLGEQELTQAGQPPFAFQVDYKASDAQLEHGLNVEARVSFGGSLRFFTLNQVAIHTDTAHDPQVIWVDPANR